MSEKNYVEHVFNEFKKNKIIAVLVVACTLLISLGALIDSCGKISDAITPDFKELADEDRILLEQKIQKALHINGRKRGGSEVLSVKIEISEIQEDALIIIGSYEARNYLLPYTGDFKAKLNGSNKIEELRFKNIVDPWTDISSDVLKRIN